MRQTLSWLVARVLARAPASPFWRLVMKPVDAYPAVAATAATLPRAPKAASKIGKGTWPGSPLLANVQRGWLGVPQFGFVALKIARLFCAFLNSCRNPFSKMLTSFKLLVRHASFD